MRKLIGTLSLVLMALGLLVAPASAYTVDANGYGFVGKGEVQTAKGWNDRAIQTNTTPLVFELVTTTVTTWNCLNNGGQTPEKSSTTTRSGVVSGVARDTNGRITGFNLNGFAGQQTVTNAGPAVGACGNGQTLVEGSIEYGTPVSVLTVDGVVIPQI